MSDGKRDQVIYNQEYYQKNKDDILEKRRNYYRENHDHILSYNKQYYQDNKEYCKSVAFVYRCENEERIKTKLQENSNIRYECLLCGGRYTKYSANNHKNTVMHRRAVRKNIQINAIP
jgi:hypothetical protein